MSRKNPATEASAIADAEAFPPSDEAPRLPEACPFRFVGPYFDSPALFQVNAGAPVHDALSLAECLLSAIRSRLSDAVGGEPLRADEAYAHEFLIGVVLSLYGSTGARA